MLRRDDRSRRTRKRRKNDTASLDEAYLEAVGDVESESQTEVEEIAVNLPEGYSHRPGGDPRSKASKLRRVEDEDLEAEGETESGSEAEPEKVADELSPDQEEPDPDRKSFGASGKAWMKVAVFEDGQKASLKELSFGADTSLAQADVMAALNDLYHIKFGINEGVIEELSARAAQGEVVQGNLPIAQGTPPVPGKDSQIEYKFLKDVEKKVKISHEELKAAFDKTELKAVLDQDLTGRMVVPDEELAIRVPATEGKVGQDVFGNSKMVPGTETHLQAGKNVRASEECHFSEIYGYVCVLGEHISVIPPIWISDDQMEAYYIHFPQVGPEQLPTSDWLGQVLELQGIKHGIDEKSIEGLCKHPGDRAKKRAVLIARGTPPVLGIDAHMKYTFDPEKKAGKILADGSVDLKERNAAVGVSADQLLGEIIPATQGRPGTNVMGEEVPTTDGEDRSFAAGENVRIEEVDGAPKFVYAEIDGAVSVNGESILVNPVFTISGDVDYSTGNIDVLGDVNVSGSVSTGFTVKARGSITIGGTVEDGASIQAKGDVVISRGIIGERVRVIALGNVETKFIQNSSVMAGENITVGSYIINGRVRSGGEVVVRSGGGGRGGSIVGGEVYATKGIEAKLIGSPATDRTLVGISPTPATTARLNKLSQAAHYCDTNIIRMLRTLGIQAVDAQALDEEKIKEVVRRVPKARQQYVLDIVKKLNELVQTQEKALKMQQNLEEQVADELKETHIKATETAFSDVTVCIGNDMSIIPENLSKPLFFKADNGIGWHPL